MIHYPVAPPAFKKPRFGKNPNVDTSFLPDHDREVCVCVFCRSVVCVCDV